MHLFKFIPIKLTLLLVIGILLEEYGSFSPLPILLITILAIVILGFLAYGHKRRNHRLFGIMVATATLGAGMLSVSFVLPKNQSNHYSNQPISMPHSWQLKVREVLKPTDYSQRYIVKVTGMDQIAHKDKLLLTVVTDSSYSPLMVDDELLCRGTAKPIRPSLNPHQFNYKKYMEGLGVYHQLHVYPEGIVKQFKSSRTLLGLAASVRSSITKRLEEAKVGKEELGIIQALLMGQRNDISAETYNNYKNAGAVHILAVSGLHIGILLLVLQFLLYPLELVPKGRIIKLVILVLILWCFAVLAGLSASVVRAVTMFSFVAYAMYLNRPTNTFNILALSMFFILLVINPLLLFQVGFQMSYAAVFAIVWIYPLFQKIWLPGNPLIRKIWQLLSVSAAAQLGVLPLSLYYFHQFPGLFFLSNLLIIPFLGMVLGLGILVILMALANILIPVVAIFYQNLISTMNLVIAWIATQEAFIFREISFDMPKLLLGYVIIFLLVMMLTRVSFRSVLAVLLGIICLQLWTLFSDYMAMGKKNLWVMHQSRNSVLLYREARNIQVLTRNKERVQRLITDFKVGENIKHTSVDDLKGAYQLDGKQLYIIDSFGILPSPHILPMTVLLTQSPKINLERLIETTRPASIIADGSNYKSFITRWKITCKQQQIPFRYTGESGAIVLD